MTPNNVPPLAAWLRMRRISGRALARALHTNESAVSRWITGAVTPRKATQQRIARMLDVEVSALWGGSPLDH